MRAVLMSALGVFAVVGGAAAGEPARPWTIRTQAFLLGTTVTSDPDGYTVYSGIAPATSVGRRLGGGFGAELMLTTTSHEVALTGPGGDEEPLGSVELLPLTLLAQYRPMEHRSVSPWIGAGACLAVFWEKSGAWDSLDLPARVAPAAQLGVDWHLSDRMFAGLDLRWIWLATKLEDGDLALADLTLDLFGMAVGVGWIF